LTKMLDIRIILAIDKYLVGHFSGRSIPFNHVINVQSV